MPLGVSSGVSWISNFVLVSAEWFSGGICEKPIGFQGDRAKTSESVQRSKN